MCIYKKALLYTGVFAMLICTPSFALESSCASDDLLKWAMQSNSQSKSQLPSDLNGAGTSTGGLTFAVYFGRPYYYAPYEYYTPYQPYFYKNYYPYRPYHFYYGW